MQTLGPRRLQQQQRRYVRPRLPLTDGLRPEADVRRICRHAGLQERRQDRRDAGHRRQPDRRAPRVRFAHEEATARRRQADRHRSAPHRPCATRRTSRRTTICSLQPSTNVAIDERLRPRDRDRGPDRSASSSTGGARRPISSAGKSSSNGRSILPRPSSRSPAFLRSRSARRRAFTRPAATPRSTMVLASPSIAKARRWSWRWPTSPWRPAISAAKASA